MAAPRWERGAAEEKSKPDKLLRLSTPSAHPQQERKNCKRCGRAFTPVRQAQRYCAAKCRNAAVKARFRARSGDTKPHKGHPLGVHREAVTFGQKSRTKSNAFFAPQKPNFAAPFVDLLDRPSLYADRPPAIVEDVKLRWADLLRRVVRDECANYPPRYRRPAPNADGGATVEMEATGFPVMPEFLRRR
jgi:hypothetical protein